MGDLEGLAVLAIEAGTTAPAVAAAIVKLYLDGRLVRPKYMTDKEKEAVKDLTGKGYSQRQIAKLLDRSKSSIYRAGVGRK